MADQEHWKSASESSKVLSLTKNKINLGSFEDHLFQLSIKFNPEGTVATPDPMDISVFDIFGFPCVPLTGVYGDDYTPCTLLTLIKLPVIPTKIIKQVPQALVECIKDILQNDSSSSIEFYISVCTQPRPGECQKFMCSNWNEVNMMYHTWLYASEKFTEDLNVTKFINMGIFGAYGIKPVHLDLKDAGITFESFEPRSVVIHSCCFSPENAQFQLAEQELCSFFSLARDDSTKRAVIVYHVLPASAEKERQLRHVNEKSSTVLDLLTNLAQVDLRVARQISDILLAYDAKDL
jgi:hypothetical protein